MSNRRWSKFWWQDWQRDPALRACCVAARGLWMDMLAIAHDGTPYGHVTINSIPATIKQLGTIAGTGEKMAALLVAELELAGVFSRTEDGTIYSRRMVRDKALSDEAVAIGKQGGNPALKGKSKEPVNGGGTGGVNPPDNRGPNHQDTEADKERKIPATLDAKAASLDIRTELFRGGLAILRSLTGKPDGPSRALIGKLLKSARDDAALVLSTLRQAADLRPAEPVAWLTAALNRPDEDARLFAALGLDPDKFPVIDHEPEGEKWVQ